ncbi:MAG: peptide deformylase [Eubacteriales bacterium]|nr:peptide deformylase [Eubacteriales bacterium]
MVKEILKLGDPALYEVCSKVQKEDMPMLETWVSDLHDTLLDYRKTYGAGRAIAAPQIGIRKRLLYMLTDKEYVFINPQLSFPDDELMEVLDDCMSFPGLCVRVMRHRRAVISYTDLQGNPCEMALEGDYSELLQHEYDHLDGILATMRAKDNKSFILMQMKR